MNKGTFVTAVGILGLVMVFGVSAPVCELRADHCHTEQSQAAPAVKAPERESRQNVQRQRTRTATAASEGGSVKSGTATSSVAAGGGVNASLEEIYSRDLPMAILSIGEAIKAAESGDKKAELAELNKAISALVTVHAAIGKHVKPQFANTRCPIMSSPIDRDKVDANLVREYKGQKVAFCCGGCPAAWDKLTDGQKQAKLSAAKS